MAISITKKTFTSTVPNITEVERGRLAIYGALRKFIDANNSNIVSMKEQLLRNTLGESVTVSLTVTLKKYL